MSAPFLVTDTDTDLAAVNAPVYTISIASAFFFFCDLEIQNLTRASDDVWAGLSRDCVELDGGDDGDASRVGLKPLHGALGAAGAAERA